MNKIFIIFILIIIILLLGYTAEGFIGEYEEQSGSKLNYFNQVNENTPKSFYEMDDYYPISFVSAKDRTVSDSSKTNIWNNEAKIPTIYENRFNFVPLTTDNKFKTNTDNRLSSSKCCLVKKVLDNNDGFEYTYTKYQDDQCNIDNFELDQNNQLLFEGYNGWSNDYCSNDTSNLGSCQHYNFECIDFVSQDKCDEYNNRMHVDKLNRKLSYNWKESPCYNKEKIPKSMDYIEPKNITYTDNI